MFNVLIVAGVVASLFSSPVTNAEPEVADLVAAPAERITLQVQTVNGSGCPAGSATVTSAADNTSFTVSYSDFVAAAGSGAKATDFRKNCQINLVVNVPQGYTFAIAKADYRGSAHLDKGATAEQLASYYFTGDSATTQTSHSFAGPLNGAWQATDVAAALIYSPCGVASALNINAELRVDAGDSPTGALNYISMERTKASAHTLFNLSWKKC